MERDGFITTEDGIRLYFQTHGSGPQAVVIPNGFHLLDDFKPLVARRTLIYYDFRNRGRSDSVTDADKLQEGIHNDVNDLEIIRRHFGIANLNIIGHSYMGLLAILYAMKYPKHVNSVVQIGPMGPFPAKQYPTHLSGADGTLTEVFAQLAELQKERASFEPEEFCRKFWSVLRVIYVTDPADAEKIKWGRCELSNERNFRKYWSEHIFPALQNLKLTADDFAKINAPVLTIHGSKDRSAPYGGGREWTMLLPNARLVSMENAGHAPWIESSETFFSALNFFLDGTWPDSARKVTSLDLQGD